MGKHRSAPFTVCSKNKYNTYYTILFRKIIYSEYILKYMCIEATAAVKQ